VTTRHRFSRRDGLFAIHREDGSFIRRPAMHQRHSSTGSASGPRPLNRCVDGKGARGPSALVGMARGGGILDETTEPPVCSREGDDRGFDPGDSVGNQLRRESRRGSPRTFGHHMHGCRLLWVLLVPALTAACGDTTGLDLPPPVNTDFSGAWPTATAAEQGLDDAKLANAFATARNVPYLRSLLVVRNGYLVSEEYFQGATPNTLWNVHSITKSVVSALVGIALEEGYLKGLDEPMADYLVPAIVPDLTQDQRAITLRHLLTMTSGIEWEEDGGVETAKYVASDYSEIWRYTLSKPVVDPPGTRWNYDSGASSLLSLVLEEATGRNTLQFAQEALFDPLGIDTVEWAKDGDFYYGASHMYLRPRDMAKIGALYVNGGRSGDRQLVPEAWVHASIQPVAAEGIGGASPPFPRLDYGYLWWIDSDPSFKRFVAWGFGGQFIYCVPDAGLVVVATTDASEISYDNRMSAEIATVTLIRDEIVGAIRR
jgi:CubicO group peptidase (beta-lactamase class C family)